MVVIIIIQFTKEDKKKNNCLVRSFNPQAVQLLQILKHFNKISLGAQSFEHANVLSEKKLISQPWLVQKWQFLEEMTLTHCILMSVIFRSHLTPLYV